MRVTKQDLCFEVPFELQATRNDCIHAFLSWFDIDFALGLKPIHFSTGPHHPYTHWKQTVFYFDEVIAIKQGETINGTLKCKPNAKNPRDLDIDISYSFKGDLISVSEDRSYHMC